MKISTRARYALRLMIDLAGQEHTGSLTVLRDVAERQQISKRYLEQLATTLKNASLVSSAQGRGGGYSLPRRPSDISVLEIIEASIGPINVVGCVDHPESCPRADDCPSRRMWQLVNGSINEALGSVTLADLCRGCEVDPVALVCEPTPCTRRTGAQE